MEKIKLTAKMKHNPHFLPIVVLILCLFLFFFVILSKKAFSVETCQWLYENNEHKKKIKGAELIYEDNF